MPSTPQTTRPHAQGFSLIELLVTISIIALLIGITFPSISALIGSNRIESGMNTVGMSADVARQWVTAETWANDGNPNPTGEIYNGTAALYCPTGEVRIVKNIRSARDGSNYLEEMTPTLNGYADLGHVEYISIPSGVGIVGIERHGTGNNVRFIAPPFAIAFSEAGQLSYGTGGHIYYDSDGDNSYNTTSSGRTAGYDPSEWDGETGSTNEDFISSTNLKRALPFERIECVPGVVIFDMNEYTDAGFDFAGGGRVDLSDPEGQWLNDNGRTLFFSPHTGIALRDER
ncbi:MAG: prepilin-type N-terminal cleavage/methylation domain-containing protein [Phycisphaeraceae bacterium]|nr:prepilin-type N-terminal cleavage/methylation domain-containing protein [Phycisphaeraceae bacterium]